MALSFRGIARLIGLTLLSALCLSQAEAQSPEIFNTSGTFTVPDGVLSIKVEAWGAGGGGGGGSSSAAGGGGGGAYATGTFNVSAGATFPYTVGTGGTAGTSTAAGTAGTDTTFGTTLVIAAGGAKGTASGGVGGLAVNCTSPGGTAYSGGSGAAALSNNGGGGGGSATSGAIGGNGVTNGAGGAGQGAGGAHGSAATNVGAAPGGGGGGKDNGSGASGAGAAGRIKITYIIPTPPTFSGAPASQNYTERTTGQLLIAPAGTIADPDATNLNGGYLKVDITTNKRSEEDKLYIQEINNITLMNNLYYVNGVAFGSIDVKHGGTLIGTISAANNGFRGSPLQVDFNASATPAMAQDLLRSIYYQDVDNDNAIASTRTLTITYNNPSTGTITGATDVVVSAEVFSITSPSTSWVKLQNGLNYDPSEDQQATSGPDLVGYLGTPLIYAKYDDKGTVVTTDDTVTFRIRVDDSINSSNLYNGYIFIGYDFQLDGDVDAFIALEGTTKGTNAYVYAVTGANISPNTTGIGARYTIPNYNTLTMSNFSKVGTIEGINDVAANSYTGTDSDPDYYQTFQVNYTDLVSVLNPLPVNNYIQTGALTYLSEIVNTDLRPGITENTPYRFLVGTATQNNAINADFGGVGRLDRILKNTTWDDLGVFPPTTSFGNEPPVITTGNDTTATYTIPENTTPVATVAATDPNVDNLVFGILTGGSYGEDGALFRIDPTTGALSFISAPDYETPADVGANNVYLVTIQVDDGKGGLDTQLVYVYVTDTAEGANAQPVITSNGSGATATISIAENSTAVTTVTSFDSGDKPAATVIAATATYSIVPGGDAALFTIDSGTGVLTFITAPNYEIPADAGTDNVYNVTVRVTDAGGPVYTDDQALIITVTDVYEGIAPVLVADTPTFPSITEDEITNTGRTVAQILNSNATDGNPGTVIGIALTSLVSSGNGTWQYSLDDGLNWIPVGYRVTYDIEEDLLGVITVVPVFTSAGTVSDSNALLLSAESRIRFLPDAKNATTASFTFRAWDESSGFVADYHNITATGGATAFSTVADTADIVVTDVNDAPTVSGGPIALTGINDYQTSTTTVTSLLGNVALTYGDVDTGFVKGVAVTATSGAGTWQYSADGTTWFSIGSVADNSALLLQPSYSVRYVPAYKGPDGGETAQLTLRGWDQTTLSNGQEGTKMDASTNGDTTPYSSGTFLIQLAVTEDTRAMAVTNVTVNEASTYAVFTVTGAANQKALLSITNTTTAGLTGIEYFDGAAWQTYTGGSYVTLLGAGSLLVRVAISPEQETALDTGETFTLGAATTGGTVSTGGTGTINDDGTGSIFLVTNDTATPNVSGDPGYPATLDDDRVMAVTNVTVNEASPYAVFTVTGATSQKALLSISNTTTTGLAGIEYFDGADWQSYTGGSYVTLPVGGSQLVRVVISPEQESAVDTGETYKLVATNTGGTVSTGGTGTINDDGTGAIFLVTNNTATPNVSGDPGYPALDDDRPMAVTNVTVNEGSPYAVFTVTGVAAQKAIFSITNTATTGLSDIEYFDGAAWQTYTSGSVVLPIGGSLLVRVAISPEQETALDTGETFKLVAATTSGTVSTGGTGTINDDGTGSIFLVTNNTATPNVSGDPGYPATLDDDRVMAVTNVTVNEASPYAVFTVTGAASQKALLSISNTTTAGLTGIEYFDGADWQSYTGGSYVILPVGGSQLVRVVISPEQETALDTGETYKLVATNTGGTVSTGGTGTINDDGTGSIFLVTNDTATPNVSGDPGYPATLDDDRVMAVTNVTVNEASPYAVFTVTGAASQKALLSISNTTTTGLAGIEYFDGADWQSYTGGSYVTLPVGGSQLVRVAISPEQESALDTGETYKLVATNTGGTVSTGGTGTINDDGTGAIFLVTNNTATPNVSGDPGYPATLDDDRVMAVTNVTVNEGSPYAVFTVTGGANQNALLSITNTTTTGLTGIQYFDGAAWQAYTGGSYVPLSGGGSLLVRVAISPEQEAALDTGETFKLVATNTGGTASTGGAGSIYDDGTGDYFAATNNTATPAVPVGVVLDDDRARIAVIAPDTTVLVDGVSTVNVGSASLCYTSTGTFTLRNDGAADLIISSITIDGADASHFVITTTMVYPLVILPGAQTTFDLKFSATLEGVYTAALHVLSNDGNTPSFDIAGTGTGVNDFFTGSVPVTAAGATIVTITGSDYTVTNHFFTPVLGYAPEPGDEFTAIDMVGGSIIGNFYELPENGVVALGFAGEIYYFTATYTGGADGKDLILTNFRPDTPAWTWVAGPKKRNNLGKFAGSPLNPGAR